MQNFYYEFPKDFLSKATIRYRNDEYIIGFHGVLYQKDLYYKNLKKKYPQIQNNEANILFYAYMDEGIQCMRHLNGAYIWYYIFNGCLHIYKDPLGLYPLYYKETNHSLCFSNDLEYFFNKGNHPKIIDTHGLMELFCFSPATSVNNTIYKNVKSIPRGCELSFHHNVLIQQYYTIPSYQHNDDLQTTADKVHGLLCQSIHEQSESVNATFLSGGLDSSILSAVISNKRLHTYALDYEGNHENFKKNDFQVSLDQEYIDSMCQTYPFMHQNLTITQKQLVDQLDEVTQARFMPGMADIDGALLWLCKQIKPQHNIVFSGECSDEIFGGYPWFYQPQYKNHQTFPWMLYQKERFNLVHAKYKDYPFTQYIQEKYDQCIAKTSLSAFDDAQTRIAKINHQLCFDYFMQTLIVRQVQMGKMANVEIRAPFANVALLEYVYNIPWNMKFYDGYEKGILRYAFQKELPNEVCWRKKNPFPKTHNPLYATLIQKKLSQCFQNENSPLHQLYDDRELKKLIDSKGASYQNPWYGQLMSGPQLLAFLYQVDRLIVNHHIIIEN